MKTKLSSYISAFLFLALIAGLAMPMQAVRADTVIVYDATSNPLPPNLPSLGFQATQTSEFGDYVHLAGTNRALRTVTVTMSDWALNSDYPSMSSDGWSHPITLNIYSAVTGTTNTVGSLLATVTQTFTIPWRPVADPTCLTPTAWRAGDGICYNGFAFNITFDMSSLNVTLPDDIIVGVAYNTQSYGASPIGAPGPYNSLNVGVLGSATTGLDDNVDRVFWNTLTAGNYTDGGAGGVGTFREDAHWGPGYGDNGTVNIQITAASTPSDVYVNMAWGAVLTGQDPDGSGPAVQIGYDAFTTIQGGIDAVASNGTVYVSAGTYVEDLTINKPLTLLGPNSTVNPNTGSRVAEAVILPAVSAPNPAVCEVMAYLSVSNVTIKGFTFNGDNPSLTSGIMIGAADVDACEIIAGSEGMGNIKVENNILKNSTYSGIDFYNYINPAATSGNYIRYNLFKDIGETTYNWGLGILIYNNFYADITDNVFTGVRTGIQTGNYYLANPGTTGSISNNQVGVWRLGLFHNLAYGSASPFTITNNTFTAETYPGANKWNGILLSSIGSAVNATVTGNNIVIPGSVSYSAPGYIAGYNVWNDTTTAPLTISGGTVTGGDYGIFVNNYEGYNSNANNTAIKIDGVTILNSGIAGVYVKDSTSNTNGATVYANVQNSTIDTNATGILVEGADATALVNFNKLSGNPTAGINNTSGVIVNGSSNWWGDASGPGVTGPGTGDKVSTNVNYSPWCGNLACTTFLTNTPPSLPSNFYGNIFDAAVVSGTTVVEAFLPGAITPITSSTIRTEGLNLAYNIDIPSDATGTLVKDGGLEGDVITFKINGVVVGTGIWHSGTNVELNFATVSLSDLSQVYNGMPKSAAFATNPTGLMVNLTYEGSSVAPTNAGSYAVVANITTPKYAGMASGTLIIAKASSTTTLSGGGTFVYNGLSRPATVSVTGAGGLNQTPSPVYSGSCIAAPVNVLDTPCTAGYSFAGDANHEASTGSTNIFITPAAGTVTLGSLSQTYNGLPKPVTATTTPAGLHVDVTYAGSATAPTNAGSYAVVATINDQNSAAGTASGTLVIGKATATLTLSDLTQTNNGVPRSATVTTVPSGLNVDITYNGSPTAPTNSGNYAVIATVNDLNYAGTASGTLVITPATHSIALVPGWNLVSFNLSPTNTAVTNVLSSVAGKYNLVYAWDASVSSSNWKKYDPTAPFGNTLVNLDEKMGFWIHMTTAGTLDVVGNVPATTTINLSTTAGGWNLVAYPSANGSLSPASIGGGNVALVYAYHANDVSDPWKLYDQSAPSWSNDLTVLAPGWGYWVKVIAPQTWNVPY